jgi:hypothetical protein
MARIPDRFNIGDRENLTVERLLLIIEEMYMDLAEAVNKKPDVYIRTTDGQITDTALSIGDININSTTFPTPKIEMLVAHPTPQTVTWKEI